MGDITCSAPARASGRSPLRPSAHAPPNHVHPPPYVQGDGKLYYGIHVQNGRLKGEAKRALRAVIERYELPVTLTPHQNLILREVEPAWKADIAAVLAAGARARPRPPSALLFGFFLSAARVLPLLLALLPCPLTPSPTPP